MHHDLRVLIVEDDGFTAALLARSLESSGWSVLGPAADAEGALALMSNGVQPDVALLDLDLGDGPDGLELGVQLRAHAPDLGIVLLTAYRSPRLLRPDRYEVPVGVRVVAKADVRDIAMLDPELRAALVSPHRVNSGAMSRVVAPNGVPLTDRQLLLMRLVADGLSNAAISDRLGIAESSVEKAITRLIRRLGLAGRGGINPRVALARMIDDLNH